jgi:chromosome segregation ATPase
MLQAVDVVKAKQESQFAALDGFRIQLQKQENESQEMKKFMHEFVTFKSQVDQQLSTLSIASREQSSSLRSLENSFKAQQPTIQSLQQVTRESADSIGKIKSRLVSYEEQMEKHLRELREVSSKNAASHESLKTTVVNLLANVEQLTAATAEHKRQLSELQEGQASVKRQVVTLESSVHPLFSKLEMLERKLTSKDAASNVEDVEKLCRSIRKDVEHHAGKLHEMESKLASSETVVQHMKGQVTSNEEIVHKCNAVSKTVSSELQVTKTQLESAMSYIKESVKAQGFTIQKLKLAAGNPGTPISSPSAATTATAGMETLGKAALASPQVLQVVGQVAQLEAKLNVHEGLLDELDKANRLHRSQGVALDQKMEMESALIKKLETSLNYEVRELRGANEQNEFALHDLSESLSALHSESSSTEGLVRHLEQELQRESSTIKLQGSTLQSVETNVRSHTADIRSLQDLQSSMESRLQTVSIASQSGDSSFMQFKSDTDAALHTLQRTSAAHTSRMAGIVESLKSTDEVVTSLVQGMQQTDSSMQALKAASDATLREVRQEMVNVSASTDRGSGSVEALNATLGGVVADVSSLQVTVNDAQVLLKQVATSAQTNSLKVNAQELLVQKLNTTVKSLGGSSSQIRTSNEMQEQIVQKLRDSVDSGFHQLKQSMKGMETDVQTMKFAIRSLESNVHAVQGKVSQQEGGLTEIGSDGKLQGATTEQLKYDWERYHAELQELRQQHQLLSSTVTGLRSTLDTLNGNVMGAMDSSLRSGTSNSLEWQDELNLLKQEVATVQRRLVDTGMLAIGGTSIVVAESAAVLSAESNNTVTNTNTNTSSSQAVPPSPGALNNMMALAREVVDLRTQLAELGREQTNLKIALDDVKENMGSLDRVVKDVSSKHRQKEKELDIIKENASGIARAAEYHKETVGYINDEARLKIGQLSRAEVGVNEKMAVLSWIARNLRFLKDANVVGAIEKFKEYASGNRELFKRPGSYSAETVSSILTLLPASDPHQNEQVLVILECILLSDSNLEMAVSRGVVKKINDIFVGHQKVLPSLASTALWTMQACCRSEMFVKAMIKDQAEKTLFAAITVRTDVIVLAAAAALVRAMLRCDAGIHACLEQGAIASLLNILNTVDSPAVREHAAGALRNGVKSAAFVDSLVQAGGLEMLVRSAKNGNFEAAAKHSRQTLVVCAKNPKYQRDIHVFGGMELLGVKYPVVK